MTRISIENLIQLLAMIGIIGSLIFVGLEMRQSQKIAIAGQQMERTAITTNGIVVHTEVGLDWTSVARNFPELADQYPPGLAAVRNYYQQALYVFENDYIQYSQGLMTDGVWQAKLTYFVSLYDQCSNRDIMQRRKLFFSQCLVELIDSLPDNCAD